MPHIQAVLRRVIRGEDEVRDKFVHGRIEELVAVPTASHCVS